MPTVEFRKECRDFAAHWLVVQSNEFQRLGVLGDWQSPYSTMAFEAEAKIAEELGKILMDGSLYRGAKPVMWSPVEKTALAEAEIEYEEHTSVTIHARFPVQFSPLEVLKDANIVIWTTTPWTMPGNRAIAYGDDIVYRIINVSAVKDNVLLRNGDRLCVADELCDAVADALGIEAMTVCATVAGHELAGTIAAHPMAANGYDFEVPLLINP